MRVYQSKKADTMTDENAEEIFQLLRPVELASMPDNPLVSLLTSNYNYALYLREAIESALAQTYANFEMIVCDDGSTDDSCEVVEHYASRDPRIKLVRKKNGGVSSALNAAYRESHGDIVCLLDADDRFLPEKLEKVVKAFRSHPDSGFLGHRMFLIDAEGRRHGLKPLFANHPSGWFGPNVVRNGDFPEGLSFGSGLCLRREISNLIFPLPEMFRSGADGVIMTLAPLMTLIIGINVPLTEYREHGKNVTNTAHVTLDFLERNLRLLRMYSELRNEYLKKVDLRLSEISPKFDELMGTRSSIYIQERLKKGGGSLSAYQKFVRAHGFRGIHPVLRWFWRCSILLPRPLFRYAVNEALRPKRVKQFVWRAVRSRPTGIMTRLRQA